MLRVKDHGLGADTINTFAVPVGGKILDFRWRESYGLQCHSIGVNNVPVEQRRVLVIQTNSNIDDYISETETVRYIGSTEDRDDETMHHAFEVLSS